MKKIVIIGANESINVLIEKAKSRGFETHVFAWQCGAIGEKTADFFYPINIADKETILAQCKEIDPDAVVSITSDFAVNTVNYVARNLGLTCNSERTDIVARNKFRMRSALKDNGLFTPWFCEVSEIEDVQTIDFPEFPLIVKPTDMWSSKGVTCVNNYGDLISAIKYALNTSLSHSCIVEGFMEGPEYSCECISYRGAHSVLAFTKKITNGPPHFVEIGHDQPADFSHGDIERLKPIMYRALDAMDIKNGASHIEFRILNDGIVGIIEIGARMGGDCIGTHLTYLSTGIDYVGAVLDIALGNKPDMKVHHNYSNSHIRFIVTQEDYDSYIDRVEHLPETIMSTGGELAPFELAVTDSSTRSGYYVYCER